MRLKFMLGSSGVVELSCGPDVRPVVKEDHCTNSTDHETKIWKLDSLG